MITLFKIAFLLKREQKRCLNFPTRENVDVEPYLRPATSLVVQQRLLARHNHLHRPGMKIINLIEEITKKLHGFSLAPTILITLLRMAGGVGSLSSHLF